MGSKPESVVEVEVRGPLSQDEVTTLLDWLGREAKHRGSLDRFLINFTDPDMKARGLDVRARMTNGKTQLVAKRGKWLGEARVETIVELGEDQMQQAVTLLSLLGISQGVACRRLINDYQIDNMVLSIVEVPGHSWFYEAEMLCPPGEQEAVRSQILERLSGMGLRQFSEDEFVAYVAKLDDEANACFDAEKQHLESLALYPRDAAQG